MNTALTACPGLEVPGPPARSAVVPVSRSRTQEGTRPSAHETSVVPTAWATEDGSTQDVHTAMRSPAAVIASPKPLFTLLNPL